MTFELLEQCRHEVETGGVPVVRPAADPWAADIDKIGTMNPMRIQNQSLLQRLALGLDITQTSEYRQANLPPYSGRSGLIDYLLL